MSELAEVKQRTVWLCAGLRKSYRVTDGDTDFGEWDDVADASPGCRHGLVSDSPPVSGL